jgi:phosphoribosylaminoimidazolecarboxamide formyltransferase / IMP cyclohydrolase
MKHNNACGVATRLETHQAFQDALAGDPVSAFGGVLCTNQEVDAQTAEEMKDLFFEVLIAPSYSAEALTILSAKKNRIILELKNLTFKQKSIRTALNGELLQDRNTHVDSIDQLIDKTNTKATTEQKEDLLFALKIAKHTKSNTIVLVKNKQLIASGTGQTSRVDALNQAIEKAARFGFDLANSVMASDAFFPFADCVEIADKSGVKAIVQPGGSIKDQDSIDYCNQNDIAMVFNGIRHFKH